MRKTVQATFGEALAHHQAGRLAEAEELYRRVLAISPRHDESLHLLGVAAYQRGDCKSSLDFIGQALRIRKDVPFYHYNIANAFKDSGRPDDAVAHYRQAIAIKPDYIEAHNNLGIVLKDLGKLEDAAAQFRKVVELKPDFAEAHNNLGSVLKALRHIDRAMEHYRRALEIKPDHATALNNLGLALYEQGHFLEAMDLYERALAIRPDFDGAHNNLGVALFEQCRYSEAAASYERALTINPNCFVAHFNESMLRLLHGDFSDGWRKYEYRWRTGLQPAIPSSAPLWDGSRLYGKTVLLHYEQGLGDSLQFVRYAPMVRERVGRVIVVCQPPLVRLFQNIAGIDVVVSGDDALPSHDFHAPLVSLPALFNTDLASIPATVPYIMPLAGDVEIWAERVKPYAKRLNIGLVWAGSPRPEQPNAHAIDRRRSMSLRHFAPLADIPDIRFFSLQKGEASEQLKSPPQGLEIVDLMDDVKDFYDTAALIANLDMVIGVDTSVAHLAGAMSKPTWVLSRFDGCWRWLLKRDDSPWYPSMRLFRQPQAGDWGAVVANINTALKTLS